MENESEAAICKINIVAAEKCSDDKTLPDKFILQLSSQSFLAKIITATDPYSCRSFNHVRL
jgi:hypothetical protein